MTISDTIADQVPHVRLNGASKNIQIQWLRAIAALMVLLFHASVYQAGSVFAVFDGRFGIFAVALFFAISGYLMAVAIARQKACLFLAHRIVRIYPIFLIVAALYYAATRLLHAPVPVDLAALSLVPVDSADYPLAVEWTLVFEVSFYMALFVVGLVGLGKRIAWIALAWLAVLAVVSWHVGDKKYLLTTILQAAEDAPFAGGLLIPFILRLKPPAWPLIIAGIAAFLPLYGFLPQDNNTQRWIAGISAVLVVSGVAALSQKNPAFGDHRAGRLFARFGDYSYALYLCHAPVLRFMAQIDHAVNLVWLASIALAIALSILLGRLDLWLYSHLKNIVNNAKPFLRNGAVLVFAGAYFWTGGVVVYAWQQAKSMQPYVDQTATLLNDDIKPEDAGLKPSPIIQALVEQAQWEGGTLTVQGWAFDGSKRHSPVAVAVFQGGHFLGASVASVYRSDVTRFYHVHMMSGYKLSIHTACPGAPVTVIAFDKSGAYTQSQNHQPEISCQK